MEKHLKTVSLFVLSAALIVSSVIIYFGLENVSVMSGPTHVDVSSYDEIDFYPVLMKASDLAEYLVVS